MKRFFLLCTSLACCLASAAAQAPGEPAESARSLTYKDSVVLGIVEGVTEYLPISSTGHLILTNAVLGLDGDSDALDKHGKPIMRPNGTDTPAPMSIKEAADGYSIIIQAGAIAAVILLYWRRIWTVIMGILGKNPHGLLLARNLLLAFLPAVFFGLLLDDWIEARLFGPLPVAVALVGGGILMLAVERWRKNKSAATSQKPASPDTPHNPATTPANLTPPTGPDLHELSIKQSLAIGLLQCVAMWPGTSRSMMTIVGGYLVGLSPVRAAEFSFLLGLITLTAAAGYKSMDIGLPMLNAFGIGPVLLGCLVAMIAAALSVHWLVSYLTRHGLALFAWYRFLLAAAIFMFFPT